MTSGFDFDRFYPTLAREASDAVIYADGRGIIRFWNGGGSSGSVRRKR